MKTQVTTVRLPEDQAEALKKLAERFGVSESVIVRWAADALIAHVERHGGNLSLPVDLGLDLKAITGKK